MTKTEFTAAKLASIDHAADDLRLTDLGFRLLWKFASAADWKTGVTRPLTQTELAEQLGCTPRAVQINRDDLVRFGYLEPIGRKPGKYACRYRVLKPKKANLASPIEEAGEKANLASPIGERTFQKGEPSFVHVLPFNPSSIPSDPTDTGDRGPRQRAAALGPPPETGKGLSNGMGKLEPGLRRLLGENFKWLAGVRLEAMTAEVVTLSATTPSTRDNAIKHCEPAILEVSGASKLEFKIELAVEPPPLRRMP